MFKIEIQLSIYTLPMTQLKDLSVFVLVGEEWLIRRSAVQCAAGIGRGWRRTLRDVGSYHVKIGDHDVEAFMSRVQVVEFMKRFRADPAQKSYRLEKLVSEW